MIDIITSLPGTPLGSPLNPFQELTKGLVFYWRGIQAGEVVDESYFRRNMTLINSPTWQGEGLHFDESSSQRADLADPILTAAPLTFICWFKVDTLPSASPVESQYLMDIGEASSVDSFQLSIQTDDKIHFTATRSTFSSATTSNTISLNTWHMAVGVTANSASRFAFLDGVKSAEDTGDRTPLDLVRFSIAARKQNAPYDHFLDGVIRQIIIYDRVLSDAELTALFINPDLPMQQYPAWMGFVAAAAGGIVVLRRRRECA